MDFKKNNPVFISFSVPSIVGSIFVCAAVALILLIRVSYENKKLIISETELWLDRQSAIIATLVDDQALNTALKTRLNHIASASDSRIRLISFSGKIVYDSHSYIPDHPSFTDILNEAESEIFFSKALRLSSLKGQGFSYEKKMIPDSGEPVHLFVFARRLRNLTLHTYIEKSIHSFSIQRLQYTFIFWFIILIILIIVINLFIAARTDKPIRESIEFAGAVADRDFSRRFSHYSSSGIGALQRSLNTLAESLEIHIQDLTIERNKLNMVIENINDAICMINTENRIIVSNKAFRKLFSLKEIQHRRNYYELIRSSELNARIESALERHLNMHFEQVLQNATVCELDINPISGDKGFYGLIVMLHDITAKKHIDTMKTELVGNLSHELKTPIAILKGYLETIELHVDRRDLVKDLLSKCLKNLERQNYIINDMLSLNRLETDRNFETEKIEICSLIDSCVTVLAPRIQQKMVQISVDYHEHRPFVIANRFLAEQVFFNIITNAVNYNKESGSIRIQSLHEQNDNGSYYCISITDTGIGIPAESIERIFERFYRVDKGRSRATGGTGLGLSIVKHSAELLGWTVSVSSNTEGSCFSVRIPLPVPEN